MAGTLLGTFVLAPLLGFTATLLSLAAVNLACALAVLLGPARNEAQREIPHAGTGQPIADGRLAATLFLTAVFPETQLHLAHFSLRLARN